MAKVVLVTGGVRSGKSAYALEYALKNYSSRIFLATAIAFDDEMNDRIERHKAQRLATFSTIEEPTFLADTIKTNGNKAEVILVDCLTVWLGNLFFKFNENDKLIEEQIDLLLDVLASPCCDMVFVTNEVGMGIVPENAMARHFRDSAGTLNRRIAAIAQEVYFSVCGIAMPVKNTNSK